MPAGCDEDVPVPVTRAGGMLLAGIAGGFDCGDLSVRSFTESLVRDADLQQEAVAVAVAATQIVLRGLFGQPADVRAVTRRLSSIRTRLPDGPGAPVREMEAAIRSMLGEPWLIKVIDFERLIAAGPVHLVAWRELYLDFLRETGEDASALICAAEREAGTGLAPEVAVAVRAGLAAAPRGADGSLDPTPLFGKLREALLGRPT